MDIICIKSPCGQGYGSSFLASYCGYNLGTDMIEQHARSAASCMVIVGHNRRNRRFFFSLFPYLLIYRTEEASGSNPAGPLTNIQICWLYLSMPIYRRMLNGGYVRFDEDVSTISCFRMKTTFASFSNSMSNITTMPDHTEAWVNTSLYLRQGELMKE